MKYTLFVLSLFLILISCSNQSELSKSFDCKTKTLQNTTIISDFKNNFKIPIPNDWKTNLYYNEFQSEIFTADTIKQLSETYILDVSFNNGNLTFDTDFYKKTDSLFANLALTKINENTIQFQNKPAYWYVVKGIKNGFTYHQFNLYILISENTYITANSEIYGDNNIDNRICESISIIEKIELIK
tara:strand:- start:757 stop:1314 length:558 start_codon:yes stop_codon:yes gene_type:complete